MTITGANGAYFWRPAAWLRVSGPDAATFLQGQFSNDLGLLSTRPAVYGLWLNQKGRVLADSFVLKGSATEEEFWVGSYFSPAAVIRERLESHIIADDVAVIDESAAWFGTTLFGLTLATASVDLRDGLISPAGAAEMNPWKF